MKDKDKIKELKDEVKTLKLTIQGMNKQYNELAVKYDSFVRNSTHTPRHILAEKIEDPELSLEARIAERDAAVREIRFLQGAVDFDRRTDRDRKINTLEIEIDNLKDEVGRLSSLLKESRVRFSQEIKANQSTLKEKESQISKQEALIKKLESSLSSSKEREGSLSEKLKLSESTIKSQKAEISTQGSSIKRLSSTLSSLEADNKKRSEDLRIAQDKIKEQEIEISALKERFKKDQQSIKLLKNDKNILETDLFVTKQKAADSEDAWRQNEVLTETVAFLWEEDKLIQLDLEKERSVVLNFRKENKELSEEIAKLKKSMQPKPNIFVRLFRKLKKLFSRNKVATSAPASIKQNTPDIVARPFEEAKEETESSHNELVTDSELAQMIDDIDKPFDLSDRKSPIVRTEKIVAGLTSAGIFSHKRSSDSDLEDNNKEQSKTVVVPAFGS